MNATTAVNVATKESCGDEVVFATVDPVDLSDATSAKDVPLGSFRIQTEKYDDVDPSYVAGMATEVNGEMLLSSFTPVMTQMKIYVEPIEVFYVAAGLYEAGTVVDFATESACAAKCDASEGTAKFTVVYGVDGG